MLFKCNCSPDLFSDCSLRVYGNTFDICLLILCPACLLNLFIACLRHVGTCFQCSIRKFTILLAFTSCLYRASRSARGESSGPSQGFPGHVHSLAHTPSTVSVCSLLDSREYRKAFQSLSRTSFFFFFWSASS